MIGSVYEHSPIKTKTFPLSDPGRRFTDDGILTVAVSRSILSGRSYLDSMQEAGLRYPNAAWGNSLIHSMARFYPASAQR